VSVDDFSLRPARGMTPAPGKEASKRTAQPVSGKQR
jgi:hypothetical protein